MIRRSLLFPRPLLMQRRKETDKNSKCDTYPPLVVLVVGKPRHGCNGSCDASEEEIILNEFEEFEINSDVSTPASADITFKSTSAPSIFFFSFSIPIYTRNRRVDIWMRLPRIRWWREGVSKSKGKQRGTNTYTLGQYVGERGRQADSLEHLFSF